MKQAEIVVKGHSEYDGDFVKTFTAYEWENDSGYGTGKYVNILIDTPKGKRDFAIVDARYGKYDFETVISEYMRNYYGGNLRELKINLTEATK